MKTFIKLLIMFLIGIKTVSANNVEFEDFLDNIKSIEKKAAATWIVQKYKTTVKQDSAEKIVDIVYQYSEDNKLNPILVLALIDRESSFNPKALSYVGASGLMQVMPKIHSDKIKGRNIFSKKVNIEVGTKIFLDCLTKKKGQTNKALSCYSGGASYATLVRKSHNDINDFIKLSKFSNEITINSFYSFDKPFVS